MDSQFLLIEEYKEVNTNMRHFSNMRFACLTISLAVNGVLIQNTPVQSNKLTFFGLVLLAVVSNIVFYIFDIRSVFYYKHYLNRALKLEEGLGFKQNQIPYVSGKLGMTYAIKLLYILLVAFWLVLILSKI